MSTKNIFDHYPKYYRHAILRCSANGFIAIVTFWTKKEFVSNILETKNYNKIITIGNCYTVNGLKYIVQNALLCPQCSHYIFCGDDNNNVKGHIFDMNFDIRTENDEMINACKTFQLYLEKHSTFCDMEQLNDIVSQIESSECFVQHPIAIIEEDVYTTNTYDSEKIGMRIHDDNLYRLWKKALMKIKLFGINKFIQDDKGYRELLGLVSVFTGELNMNEIKQYDIPNIDIIDDYITKVCEDNYEKNTAYTYGTRLHLDNQIQHIIEELSNNSCSRRCISVTWQSKIDTTSLYPPCLILIDCKIQTNKLYMTCYFRSHDIYNAYCMNLIALKQLQKKIINNINEKHNKGECVVSDGDLMIVSNSAHVYKQDFNKLQNVFVLDCALDERGYFIISTENGFINVMLMDKQDNVVCKWKDTKVHKLLDNIQPFISEISHALYIGKELYKAKTFIKFNKSYTQS